MINKKILLISIFIITLLTISAVSAATDKEIIVDDVGGEMAIGDVNGQEIIVDDVGGEMAIGDVNGQEIIVDDVGGEMAIDDGNNKDMAVDGLIEDDLKINQKDSLSSTKTVSGNTFADIQNAVDSASAGDTISLSGNYTGDGNEIKISKALTIEGNGAILNGESLSRILSITAKNVIINNVSFANAKHTASSNVAVWDAVGSEYNGGAIFSDSDCKITNCIFLNCFSDYHGGALELTKNSQVINSHFEDCTSLFDGGAMRNGYAINCTFYNCFAGRHGGGVSNGAVNNSSFYHCQSIGDGGATSECNAYDSLMDSCSAEGSGGAMYMTKSHKALNCTFKNCSAESDGGATYGGTALDCSFEGNSKPETVNTKTAIPSKNSNGEWVINNTSFSFIQETIDAAKSGDTIRIYGTCNGSGKPLNITKSLNIVGDENAVLDGKQLGLIMLINANSVNVSNLTFFNGYANSTHFFNNENYSSGAIKAKGNNINIEKCDFINNQGFLTGAIDLVGDSSAIKNCYFENNKALLENGYIHTKIVYDSSGRKQELLYDYSSTAGALIANVSNSLLENCEFVDNEGYQDYIFTGTNNKINLNKINLYAPDLTKYYGGLEKFTVTVTDKNQSVSNAEVNISINGKTKTVTTNSKGQASLDLNLTPGTYEVSCDYGGVFNVSTVIVQPTIISKDINATYLSSKVNATFLNTDGKALKNTKVSFKVGSKTYTATTNSNGVATANVDLAVGNYTVTAINPKNNEQKTSKLTISKLKPGISLSSTCVDGVVTLSTCLSPPGATGNVIFTINNKNYTAKINSSEAIQSIKGLNVGNYTAKAYYAGDKNFASANISTKVTVKKVTPTKIIYEDMTTGPVAKSEGRIGNYFCVKLVDEKNNPLAGVPIKIGFNGVIYNRTTESDGGARLQINLAIEDLYTFAICFLGDDDYQASFEVAKIDVNKKYPKPNMANKTSNATKVNATQHESRLKTYISYSNMDTKSVLKAEGRAGEYFVVKLLDNNKKALANVPIKIGFNGVIYNRTTNATGEARLQINLLKPTLYTFAIAYLGDTKYQASFEVAKITVKAQTPKLTSASKTFKASAKTKSISATLVSARSAAISGQKVSFTVNGKTYTGKTNAKGVATVNISLNKKGTYSCTVKFAGMTGASAKTTKTAVKIN